MIKLIRLNADERQEAYKIVESLAIARMPAYFDGVAATNIFLRTTGAD